MNEKKLSLKWLPLAWAAPLLTTLTFAIFPTLSINPRSIALTLGISDMFIFSLLVYKIWTLAVVIALYCLLRRKGITLADIGLKGSLSLKVVGYALLGAAVAFFMYPLIEAFIKVLGMSMYWDPEKALPVSLVTMWDLLFVFSLSVVLAPVLEEILFRGYILIVFLQKGCKTFIALLLSAFVFASIHFAFGPGLMLYILFWTFIPSLLYLKFKSLYPAMLMHSLNNLIAYVILPLLWGEVRTIMSTIIITMTRYRKKKGRLHRLTADKREIKDFSKLPSATSFIRKTLAESFKIDFRNRNKRQKCLSS